MKVLFEKLWFCPVTCSFICTQLFLPPPGENGKFHRHGLGVVMCHSFKLKEFSDTLSCYKVHELNLLQLHNYPPMLSLLYR